MTIETKFNNNRTFGVELEVIITNNNPSEYRANRNGLYEYLKDNGVNVHRPMGYHGTGSFNGWKMESDSSLRTNGHADAIEVISPVLKGQEGMDELKKVMDLCVAFGCTVNSTCGTHVHHGTNDLSGRDLKMVYELYQRGQEFINGMLAPSRSRRGYCTPFTTPYMELSGREYMQTADPASFLPRVMVGHHLAMNFGGYVTRGAIEFRQHQGTVDFKKLSAWIILTQQIIEAAKVRKTVRSAKLEKTRFWEMIGMNGHWSTKDGVKVYYTPSDELVAARQFLKKRINHFARAAR